MLPKVFCDTDIWYKIGDGIYCPEQFKNVKLVATFYSLTELCTTFKIAKDPLRVKRAGLALLRNSYQQIINNFPDALLAVDTPFYKSRNLNGSRYIRALGNFCAMSDREVLQFAESRREEILLMLYQNKFDYTNAIKNYNETMLKDAKQIVLNMGKKKARSLNLKPNLVKNFRELVKIYGNEWNTTYVLKENFDWSKFEFLIYILEAYYKDLWVDPKMRSKDNDLFDCFNLVYVRPGDMYWTDDKLILRLAKETGMTKYLFVPTSD
jgi:hypothetical protein